MKTTDHFKEVIENYLKDRATNDQAFALLYAKADKNINDCISYILETVHKSGCNGFTDDEVFSLAIHYYPK